MNGIAAFTDSSPRRGVPAPIVYVETKVALNVPAHALRVQLKVRIWWHVQLDSTMDVGDLNVPKRGLGPQFHQAVTILHFDCSGDIVQVHLIRPRVQLERTGDGSGAKVAVAHGNFSVQFGELQVRADRLEMQPLANAGE